MSLIRCLHQVLMRPSCFGWQGHWSLRPNTPIAAAIVVAGADADSGTVALPDVEGFVNYEGLGVSGVVDGHAVVVGRRAVGGRVVHALDDATAAAADLQLRQAGLQSSSAGTGKREVWWSWPTRPSTSAQAISLLRGLGLTPVLLTGDTAALPPRWQPRLASTRCSQRSFRRTR